MRAALNPRIQRQFCAPHWLAVGADALPSLIFRHNNKTGTECTIGNYFIESYVGLLEGLR
jgi:hypothetical protein